MDKFTKEQQVQAVYDLKVGYTLGHADIAMLKSMAHQLLASMEQEPVAWVTMQKEFCDDERTAITNRIDADRYICNCYDLTPLYAAPQLPQPAVAITQHFDTIALDTAKMVMCDVNRRDEFLGGDIQLLSRIQCRIDEAFRAAMQSDGTLTNEGTRQTDELVMWVKRLAHSLRKANPDSKLQSEAMDCLSRKGLVGVEDILR